MKSRVMFLGYDMFLLSGTIMPLLTTEPNFFFNR